MWDWIDNPATLIYATAGIAALMIAGGLLQGFAEGRGWIGDLERRWRWRLWRH